MCTLDIIERTGVDIPHKGALEILSDNGAKVDGNRVRIPSWMVEKAILRAPHRLVLETRTGKRTVLLERDKTFFGPSLDCVDYMDPKTHVRSRFVSENVKITAALCDALLFRTSGCPDAKLPEQIHKELENMAKTWVEGAYYFGG